MRSNEATTAVNQINSESWIWPTRCECSFPLTTIALTTYPNFRGCRQLVENPNTELWHCGVFGAQVVLRTYIAIPLETNTLATAGPLQGYRGCLLTPDSSSMYYLSMRRIKKVREFCKVSGVSCKPSTYPRFTLGDSHSYLALIALRPEYVPDTYYTTIVLYMHAAIRVSSCDHPYKWRSLSTSVHRPHARLCLKRRTV